MNASYSQLKTGGNVTHLIFTFSPKEEPKPKKAKAKSAEPLFMSREYIEKHTLPGESREQAARRLQPRVMR